MKLRTLLTLFGMAARAQLAAPLALAQGYPSRPIKLIVPYGTGGGSDTLARQIGARLQTIWGQGVAMDNHSGALGNIETEAVVKSLTDGYMLLLNNTRVVNPAFNSKLNYDPEVHLTPMMLLELMPVALVVSSVAISDA